MDSATRIASPFRSLRGASPSLLSALIAGVLLSAFGVILALQGVLAFDEPEGEESGATINLIIGLHALLVGAALLLRAWLLRRAERSAGPGGRPLLRGLLQAVILLALAVVMLAIMLFVGLAEPGAGAGPVLAEVWTWTGIVALYTIGPLLLAGAIGLVTVLVLAIARRVPPA